MVSSAPLQNGGLRLCRLFFGDSHVIFQIRAVGSNELFIVVEGLLAQALAGAFAVVILIHIDHAVALGHLGSAGRDQVDGAPPCVAEHVHAICDRLPQLLHMGAHVVDAVVVLDLALFIKVIHGSQTILGDEDGLVVAVINAVQGDTEADGVNGPAPLGLRQVGVLDIGHQTAGGLRHRAALIAHDVGHVVADGDEVHRTLFEDLHIILAHLDVDVVLIKEALHIVGILTGGLHIGEEPVEVILEHDLQLILGLRGLGVVLQTAEHVAHLGIRIDLVQFFGGQCACHELVVHSLELLLPVAQIGVAAAGFRCAFKDDAAAGKGVGQHIVDLVEGEPILDQGQYDLPEPPKLADFDQSLQDYKAQVQAEIAQEAAAAGMTVEEYAAAGFEAPQQDSFSIYQLRNEDSTRDYRFEPYDRLQAADLTVDKANYEEVYSAPLTAGTTLEDIYRTFNVDHPADFKGHSLSVSDVVVLHQNGQNTAHYCDSVGFQQVPEFLRENPLRTAELSIEQNENMIDGVLNNAPSLGELEAKAKAGEQISLTDLAAAVKAEEKAPKAKKSRAAKTKKPSIRAQLDAAKKEQSKQTPPREKTKELEV